MEQRHGNRMLGIVIFAIGLYWACSSLGFIHFNIFFAGWWTLFIIVPSLVGLSSGKSRGSSVIGLILGIMLLLWRQGVVPGSWIPGIAIASIFILIGLSIMFGDSKGEKKDSAGTSNYTYSEQYSYSSESTEWTHYDANNSQNNGSQTQNNWNQSQNDWNQSQTYQSGKSTYETCPPRVSAIMVGKSVSCLSGIFSGTSIQAVLGNIQLDLRQAKIETDVYVNVSLILGGADIYLPQNVRVVCETQSILGDVRDIRKMDQQGPIDGPAIHIVGNCILGGMELK